MEIDARHIITDKRLLPLSVVRNRMRLMTLSTCSLVLLIQLLAVAASAEDVRTVDDGQWHFAIAPYFWTASLNGDVSFEGLPQVPVDASFSDIWSNLDFAVLGHFEGRRDRWGFGTDFIYMNLGAVASPELGGGRIEVEADIRMLLAEGFAFRRLGTFGESGKRGFADVLVGARLVGNRSELTLNDLERPRRTIDWVDAMLGLRAGLPLTTRLGLTVRGDIAGFGSEFSWQLQGLLTFNISDRWIIAAGYRHLDLDYDQGEGLARELFSARMSGPLFGFQYAW